MLIVCDDKKMITIFKIMGVAFVVGIILLIISNCFNGRGGFMVFGSMWYDTLGTVSILFLMIPFIVLAISPLILADDEENDIKNHTTEK